MELLASQAKLDDGRADLPSAAVQSEFCPRCRYWLVTWAIPARRVRATEIPAIPPIIFQLSCALLQMKLP